MCILRKHTEPENITAACSYTIELQLLLYYCMRFSQKLMCPVYQQLQRTVCLNILIEEPDFDMTLIFSFQCHNDLPRLALLLQVRGSQETVFADTNLKVIQDRTPQGPLCSTLVHPQDTYLGFLSTCSIPLTGREGTHRRAH